MQKPYFPLPSSQWFAAVVRCYKRDLMVEQPAIFVRQGNHLVAVSRVSFSKFFK